MNTVDILRKARIIPDPSKDQFFLIDDSVIQKMIDLADLSKKDIVLEVGAGTGSLTRELAKEAGEVIAFEIDERFRPTLQDLPLNIDLRFENAWEYIQLHGKSYKGKKYNKIIANLPYSFAEQFLHNLTFLIYDKAILLLPQHFVVNIEKNPVFGSFFKVDIKLLVPKTAFYPTPKTVSCIIELIHLPDAIQSLNLPLFLRQFMYQHEDTLVKNSLREGLIQYIYKTTERRLSKKIAKSIIEFVNIESNLMNEVPGKDIYDLVSEKFDSIKI